MLWGPWHHREQTLVWLPQSELTIGPRIPCINTFDNASQTLFPPRAHAFGAVLLWSEGFRR